MQDVYQNTDEFKWYARCLPKYWWIQQDKEPEILIVFDHMIADMLNNKKLNSVVIELFIRERKWNVSLVFIMQSYLKVPRDFMRNTTLCFIATIPNKG